MDDIDVMVRQATESIGRWFDVLHRMVATWDLPPYVFEIDIPNDADRIYADEVSTDG